LPAAMFRPCFAAYCRARHLSKSITPDNIPERKFQCVTHRSFY
jgi:hypothetical protein